MKSLEAVCVTSSEICRKQIIFNEVSGLIEDIGQIGIPQSKLDFSFNDDCYLFPGMGDVHIHAREDISGKNNYKEDFLSAREAMHNGGLVHAGDMPNNPIPPVDDKSYEDKFKLALKAHGELWLYAGIGPDTRPLSYPVPYKVYMGPSIGELFFKDFISLDQTLERYKGLDVSFHCEDPDVLQEHSSGPTHHERRPVKAEVIATKDALSLIRKNQLNGKLCHYSSGEGLELVRKARADGIKVFLEATPQHLYFDLDKIESKPQKFYQMNPPIRKASDREALFHAFKNGEIDFLATDHAPHTEEEKNKGTSGLTGLDTFGGFVTWLISEGVDPKIIAKAASENPGIFYNKFLNSWKNISPVFSGLGKGLGFLDKGYRANFTVLNMKKPLNVTKEFLKTKVKHSPFLDVSFPGQLEALFIGGQKV